MVKKARKKLVDHVERPTADAFKIVSKREIQKIVEVTGYLIGNTTADKITSVSKASSKNNPETNEDEVLKERFIPSELKRKVINDLRLREENHLLSKIQNYLMISN